MYHLQDASGHQPPEKGGGGGVARVDFRFYTAGKAAISVFILFTTSERLSLNLLNQTERREDSRS